MFVVLGDILELLVTDGAVKRSEHFRYFGLESDATCDVSLSSRNNA